MHAKASIPAWAKLLAISALVLAGLVLLVVAPWRPPASAPCDALLNNIEIVRSGRAERRVSTAFAFDRRGAGPRVKSGDFAAALSLDGVRACLGDGWTEIHATARATDYGDAWVFSRSGEPLVLFVRSHAEEFRRVETKIVIERAR
jgi:hypothetical protein